jgi:hypothetical protein
MEHGSAAPAVMNGALAASPEALAKEIVSR